MIVTVTLNPAIDKYVEVDNIKYEDTMRVENVDYEAGGKGINVSRVTQRFGVESTALYFGGGYFGKVFAEFLQEENITHESVAIGENIRINYTVFNRKNQQVLKFNDPGPSVDEDELAKMKELIKSYAKKDNIFVFSGSLPANCPIDIYADFINEIKHNVKYVLLDTESDILIENLKKCSPDFIKPNISETGRILQKEMKDTSDFIEALELLEKNVKYPIISAAQRGAFFRNNEDGKFYNIIPPQVKSISTVGAGDSFVAGFIMSIAEEKSLLDAIKMGVACGTATVLTPGTELCYPKDVLDLLDQSNIRLLS